MRWTEYHARDSNLIEAPGYNKEFNAYKGELNGDLQRDNLPDSSVANAMVGAGANHQFWLQSDMEMDSALVPAYASGTQELLGCTWETYRGDWHVHQAQNVDQTFYEGMLEIEFHCLCQRSSLIGDEWTQWRILFNGVTIWESDLIKQVLWTQYCSVSVPCPSGPGKVEVAWRTSTPDPGATSTLRAFKWAGGQLLVINRYR